MNKDFLETPLPPDLADLPYKEALALAAAARAAGFAVFELDGAWMKSKPQLMEYMAQALGFPGDFGHNWDAAIDYLGDLATFHKNNKILVVIDPAEILKADVKLYADLRKVCGLACENARQWSRETVILKFVFLA